MRRKVQSDGGFRSKGDARSLTVRDDRGEDALSPRVIEVPVKRPAIQRMTPVPPSGKEASREPSRARKRKVGLAKDEAPALRVLPPATVEDQVVRRRRVATTRARVLVMDGHPLVGEWIGTLIAGEADLVFEGHASGLEATASLVARGHPTLVLLEIAEDVSRGLAIVHELKERFPKVRMLVFSSCDEIAYSVQALRAGAHGFVSKASSGTVLRQAVGQVLAGGVYLSSTMIGYLAGSPDTLAFENVGRRYLLMPTI